jgi:flagellar M-ring protein FliF
VRVNDRLAAGDKPTATPRTPAELARIDTLVRSAVGVDSARGDVLSVVNVSFDAGLPATGDSLPTPTLLERVQTHQRPLLTGFALLLMAVVAMSAIRAMNSARPAPAPAPEPTLALLEPQEQVILVAPPVAADPIILQEIANPVRDQVIATVEQRPEASARVIRSWLKDD